MTAITLHNNKNNKKKSEARWRSLLLSLNRHRRVFMLLFPIAIAFLMWAQDAPLEALERETLSSSISAASKLSVRNTTATIRKGPATATKYVFSKPTKKQAVLPDYGFENGGLVLFLHVPKSGGTTIREAFTKAANAKWYFPMGVQHLRPIMEKDLLELEQNGPQGKVHFLEIHDYNVPTLVELQGFLKKWRTMANAQNISYFAFSVLRDPVSFQLSYFNYYHIQRTRSEYKRRNATEEDFLKSIKRNPQCTYLSRGEFAWHDRQMMYRNRPFSESDCDRATFYLYEHMDWVGTTDRLQDTLELVSNLTRVPLQNSKLQNPSRKYLSLSDLNETTIEYVKNITKMDQELYDRVKHDWDIKEWKELQSHH